ncbi:hypothetical protein EV421DRAFT_1827190 [Armillaria borealis]|uniref:Uncharacterized protein n=1 Tax=Armillaria borealis TaxID=47425 RepID=A0AA39ML95_9AGAR|nr:hypothetical protein EV421DRAFT_1827190 [Armillaria borealis]
MVFRSGSPGSRILLICANFFADFLPLLSLQIHSAPNQLDKSPPLNHANLDKGFALRSTNMLTTDKDFAFFHANFLGFTGRPH